MADSAADYVGRIMHPIWPGNTSGSLRRSWNTLQGRGRPRWPSEPDPTKDERAEGKGRVNTLTVSASDGEM